MSGRRVYLHLILVLVFLGVCYVPAANAQCTITNVSTSSGGQTYGDGMGDILWTLSGGSATIQITFSTTGCQWSVSGPSFVTFTTTSGISGNTSLSIPYTVAPNAGAFRSGSISVNGGTSFGSIGQMQNGSSCTISVSPPSANIPASGGSGSVQVSAGGCWYQFSANTPWLTTSPTPSPLEGYFLGSVPYSVAANSGSARNTPISFSEPGGASTSFTINQAAATPPLSINCAPPGTATVGIAYAETCSASGGTQPYKWSYSNLPPWLTGPPTGNTVTLTGTPPSPSQSPYTVTVTVTDSSSSVNLSQSQSISISVVAPSLNIDCLPPGPATAGVAYSETCTASGGIAPYQWSYSNRPAWLTAPATGNAVTLTGTPPTPPPSSYTITVTVTDNSPVPQTQSQTVTVNVSGAALTLNCPPPGSATAGQAYSESCTASGGKQPYQWSYSNRPGWLSAPATGSTISLTGTPPSPPPGSYTITVAVTDSSSPTAQTQSQTITINVSASSLTVNCTQPVPATAGAAYSESCTASGGTPPYQWTYGTLPAWLTGPPSGTVVNLTGTPPSPPPSSYTITITATDNSAPTHQSQSQTITVNVGAATLTLSCSAPSSATVGSVYSASCTVSGGTSPYSWNYTNLPSWLSGPPTGSSITLTGTPASAGSFSIGIAVSDSTSPTKLTQLASVTITASVPAVQGITISQNNSGSASNQTNLLVQFGQPAQANYTGTLALKFTPDPALTNWPANQVDPAAGFPVSAQTPACGSGQNTACLMQDFSVNQGQSQASVPLGLGTVAGTWTVTLTALSGGLPSNLTPYTVTIPIAAPVIIPGSVKIGFNSTNTQLAVQLAGYATSRDVAGASFVFSAAGGDQLTGTSVSVPFNGTDQSQWFGTGGSDNFGGTFSLTVPFAYSGDPSAVGSVTVTLSDSRGQTSSAVTGTH